jgi:hypothetical protein
MRIQSLIRILLCTLFAGFSGISFSGCGEDVSETKTVIPEMSPAEKAKESQEAFLKQMQPKTAEKPK